MSILISIAVAVSVFRRYCFEKNKTKQNTKVINRTNVSSSSNANKNNIKKTNQFVYCNILIYSCL